MSFKTVQEFEKKLAEFFGAPYAVATDCCTHAIELSLRYTAPKVLVSPEHTYISVPFTFEKLQFNWKFEKTEWSDYYYVSENIIDAAVYWQESGYIPNTFMCVSFQFKKHLNLGRGGVILCDKEQDYVELKKMSYDGRLPNDTPWSEQDIDCVGYHYYMTPETAELGLQKLEKAKIQIPKKWSWTHYPNLTKMKIFNKDK